MFSFSSHVQKISFRLEKIDIIHLRIDKKYFFKFRLSKLLEICSTKNKLTDRIVGNDFIHSFEDKTKKRITSEIEPPLLCLA